MTITEALYQLFFGPVAWTTGALSLVYSIRAWRRGEPLLPEGTLALNFLVMLVISVAMLVLSYLLAPRPKSTQPDATKDFDAPTSAAGRPIPVVFGTKIVKSPNVLWWGDKQIFTDKVSG